MTIRITKKEFEQLRNFIEESCGITLGDEKAYLIENRLSNLAHEHECQTFGELYEKLCNASKLSTLFGSMVDAITTNETLWFRDNYPFEILTEHILPQLKEELISGRRSNIKIWSAACSTGQEPYSIGMTVLDYFDNDSDDDETQIDNIEITASDISPSALSRARGGVYNSTAISRGLSPEYLERFFDVENNNWIISDRVKSLITFNELNLKDASYGTCGPFDIIFLRNVIIYFSDAFKETLLNHIARLINHGGFMFLGAGETVSGYCNQFDILDHKGSLFYKVRH
jgi:chemotaxis protein methyltransferase CheR